MNKDQKTIFGCVGLIVSFVVLIVISAIMNGWALSILWSWFVVPVFNVAKLSIPQAIGIGMVVSMLLNKYSSESKKSEDLLESLFTAGFTSIFGPLMVLFIGWIVTLFL